MSCILTVDTKCARHTFGPDVFQPNETDSGHSVTGLKLRMKIELSGGQKIQLGPGQILLIEDLTGKGHVTRTVGQEDWVSVLVPLEDR